MKKQKLQRDKAQREAQFEINSALLDLVSALLGSMLLVAGIVIGFSRQRPDKWPRHFPPGPTWVRRRAANLQYLLPQNRLMPFARV